MFLRRLAVSLRTTTFWIGNIMNKLNLLINSIAAAVLASSLTFALAQSGKANDVNEAGAKTTPSAGSQSQSNAADDPKPAGAKSTSNLTRKQSTAAGKNSSSNEAGTSNQDGGAAKPKAASKTVLMRDSNGKFVPRSRNNGSSTVKDNNEAGAKSTNGSQSQSNPANPSAPLNTNK
jgi:cytoskeletal protein RodZ